MIEVRAAKGRRPRRRAIDAPGDRDLDAASCGRPEHAELAPDLLRIDRLAFVGEGGVAGDDEAVGQMREIGGAPGDRGLDAASCGRRRSVSSVVNRFERRRLYFSARPSRPRCSPDCARVRRRSEFSTSGSIAGFARVRVRL